MSKTSWRRACAFVLAAVMAGAVPGAQAKAEPLEPAVAAELRALVAGVGDEGAPGGLLGVLRRGEPCFVHAFGLAEREARRPVARDTVFYVASVAKAFTAACVLHAAESGKLGLDDPLSERVSGLPATHAPLRLRHLLEHRSGLRDIYDLAIGLDLGRAALASNEAALARLRSLPGLDQAPGTRFRYSNSGYVLLAEALRGATGTALPAYARAHLFEPLGMASARWLGEPELAELPRARGYARAGDSWTPLDLPTGLVGPGGLWASFDDLARWEKAAFDGGWGTEELRRSLVTPTALASGASLHPALGPYAAGVMIGEDRGLAVVRTAGEAFGFGAEILRYPEQELSVVVLTNADQDLDDLAEAAAGVVLREELAAARPAAAPARSAAPDPARFGRFWREEDSGVVWVLTCRPERMVATSLGDWKVELVPSGPDRFVAVRTRAPVELRFEPASGAAERMLVLAGGVEVARCRPYAASPVGPLELAAYGGEYALPALDAVLVLHAEEGGLRILQRRPLLDGPPFVLPLFVPLGGDLFVCDAGAQMEFRRDEKGAIDALRLDLNRASGLVLERR